LETKAAAGAIAVEARTLRKIRVRIIPFIFLLYIVSFLDRSNIGFAALTMNQELGITSRQFGLLSGIFFIGYFLFELPSNLLMHRVGARIWIARILITWGAVAVLTGFARGVRQLYVMRFLLGLAEAGYFPGILLYLTHWFPRREQARAIALLMAGIPVTYIIGAPVSGLSLDHVHWLAISSWRWLLILEGLPAAVCGVLTYFLLPSRPAEAAFLAQDEKDWIASELAREQQEKTFGPSDSALRALSDRRVWHVACMSFTIQIGGYAIAFWLPQGVKSLSSLYSNTLVGFLVVIPYMATLVAMILVARSSDRRLERRWHTAIPLTVGGIALLSLGAASSPWLSITLWSFAAMQFSANGPFFSLPGDFLAGASAASGIAVVTSLGSLGGFVGPFVIGALASGSGGIYRGLSVAGVSFFASATLALLLPKRPPRRQSAQV